jgi:endonuclease-3
MTKKQKANIVLKNLKKIYPSVSPPLKHSNPFELLVAVILSAQCTDKMVNIVTENLFSQYKNLDDYTKANSKEFEKVIKPTGFYRNKTKNILKTATIIKKNYKGKVPDNMEDLVKLPGVGRKTANVMLWQAFHKNQGIAVDTHVIRLSQKFDLTTNKDPKKIEQDLMTLIPKNEWGEFTLRIILYGREFWPAHKKKDSGKISALLKI